MTIKDKRNSLTKHATKKYLKRKLESITSIAIHHSATKQGSSEAFARYHVDHNDWPGIAYSYVINKDGSVDFCQDIETVTYHVGNSNRKTLGICLVGNFTAEKPTKAQLKASAELCKMLITEISTIKEIKGHSDFQGYSWKECPAFDVMQITNRMK